MAYTFCFSVFGKRKTYGVECGRCQSTLYFVLQESRENGEMDCPFCSRALKIWEIYDSKEDQERIRRYSLQEQEEGRTRQAQDKEESPETTQGYTGVKKETQI